MFSFILSVLFAIFFGGLVSYTNEKNGNPHHLTLRGKRVVFATAIVMGFLFYLVATHFYINCDLRTGAHTTCSIWWGK